MIDSFLGFPPVRVGAAINAGHIEASFREDTNGDGRPELFFGGADSRTGMGMLVQVDETCFADSLGWGTDLSAPASLNHGVRLALKFPRDSFVPTGCPSVLDGRLEGGELRVTTSTDFPYAGALRQVNFYLDVRDPAAPRVVRASITDRYRNALRGISAFAYSPEREARVCQELARGVLMLTPEGWYAITGREQEKSEPGGEGP